MHLSDERFEAKVSLLTNAQHTYLPGASTVCLVSFAGGKPESSVYKCATPSTLALYDGTNGRRSHHFEWALNLVISCHQGRADVLCGQFVCR